MNNRKHYAAAISAFVVWGFFAIPLRLLSDYPSGEILFFRIVFSFLVLAMILPFKRHSLRTDIARLRGFLPAQRRKVILLTLAGGCLLTINWLTFIYIVNHINIKTASFSYLICPVITAVLGYVVIKEHLTRTQWVAVSLCALSCVLMGLNSSLELGFSFLTAATYALYLITQRINQGFDRIVMLTFQVAVSLIILGTAYGFLVESVPQEPVFYLTIVVIAVVFTVIPLFLNLFALNRINSATIGILMYLNPIFNFTVAFVVFNEKVSMLQLLGYAIIIVALVIFNLQNIRRLHTSIYSQSPS